MSDEEENSHEATPPESPSPPEMYSSESDVLSDDSAVDIMDVKRSVVEKLKESFKISGKEAKVVKDLKPKLSGSGLHKYIADRNANYETYKKNLKQFLTKTSKFQHELFERVVAAIRNCFKEDVIKRIGQANPSEYFDLFQSFSPSTQMDIATIIDLMQIQPECNRFLLWIARNLCQSPMEQAFGCDPSIKCLCYATTRDFFGKHSTYYWAVLYNDNSFKLYNAKDHKLYKTVQCDVISLSHSEKSIKILSNPSKIDVIIVPPEGYDKKTWESMAVRNSNIPYYSSLPYFMKPMPMFVLESAKNALISHDLYVLRALLKPNIIPVSDSSKILKYFLNLFSAEDMVNSYFNLIVHMEIFQHGAKEKNILKEESYLTHLIDIVISEYCTDYFRTIIAPLLIKIDKKPMVFTGSVDDVQVNSMIAEVINTITLHSDKVPQQFRHLASIIEVNCGVRYGTQKASFLGPCEFFFVRFLVQMMNHGKVFFPDFNPVHSPSEFLANFGEILIPLARMESYTEVFSGMMSLNDALEPHRVKIFKFIKEISQTLSSPKYPHPDEKLKMESLDNIIEIISNHRVEFIVSIQNESLTQAKTPIAGEVMHFLYSLSSV